MTKVQVKNNIFYYEVSSKSNYYIIVITLYMWGKHNFETIFTFNDVINIQYAIGKGFGYCERSYYVGVNAIFFPRITNIRYAPPNYGPW